MSNSLPQPIAWQSLPFGDKSAFIDWLGQHDLWHRALDHQLAAQGVKPYPSLSLGDGPGDENSDDWHATHQTMHDGEAGGLGLSGSADFSSYNLNDRDEFATWTFLHAQEHERLASAAGI